MGVKKDKIKDKEGVKQMKTILKGKKEEKAQKQKHEALAKKEEEKNKKAEVDAQMESEAAAYVAAHGTPEEIAAFVERWSNSYEKKYKKQNTEKAKREYLEKVFPEWKITKAEKKEYKERLKKAKPAVKKMLQNMDVEINQISKMKYIMKEDQVPHYAGRIRTPKGREGDIKHLTAEYVEQLFQPKYIAILQGTPNTWYQVPLGDSSDDIAPSALLTDVYLEYEQKNEDHCLFYSFCSALDYMGKEHTGQLISVLAKKNKHMDSTKQMKNLDNAVKEHLPIIGTPTVFNQRGKKKTMTVKSLINEKSPWPTIVIPRAHDGGISHAITVIDDLIFDSTQEKAMKLTKESLDWICIKNGGIESIYAAHRYCQKYNLPKHKSMKRVVESNW